ncbi:MAG: UDP-N-acetylmuramate dehydrogenase [Deltaproteobacteria bacterium]|nr:UDP-N-acetylmuramate dehydrogenase [Deltaproteobacteria bacterium]
MGSFVVQHDVALARLSTLELGGSARYFAEITDEVALFEALTWAQVQGVAVALIAGGSNVIVPDEGFDGLVMHMATRGERVDLSDHLQDKVRVTVAAGEVWDDFVARCVARGWAGIECLSGIPGSVGATPIQNVGAYGQEVSQRITELRVWSPSEQIIKQIDASACEFAYRDSALKRGVLAGCIVLSVTFELTRDGAPTVRYAELAQALAARGLSEPTLADVRALVISLRQSKSMVIREDDPNRRSVGSFFTNPIVSPEKAAQVSMRALSRGLATTERPMPQWLAAQEQVKLSAAWLIERAGCARGERVGSMGLSSKHTLAIVHHGGGSTAELLAFASTVVSRVSDAWGIELDREPVLLRAL